MIFARILRGSKHLSSKPWIHWVTWRSCTGGVSLIVASALPSFGTIILLIGALFGTFITWQPYGAMWLYDNKRADNANRGRWMLGTAWAVFVVVAGFFFQVAGTYGSVVQIINLYSVTKGRPWSCVDNSGSRS